MSDPASAGSSRARKRFWLLAALLAASVGSFLVSLWGFVGNMFGAVLGLFMFTSKYDGELDPYVYGGLFFGSLFLILFIVMWRKLKA